MTPTEIEKNKTEFINTFKQNIKREGANELLDYLEKSDFFEAPASTKYHLAEEGGLCQHTLNVHKRLHKLLKDNYGEDYLTKFDIESLTLVSLLHDICKVHFYKKDFKNTKVDGQWVKEPIYVVDERLHYGHGTKSVFMIQQFLKLYLDEALAIRYHMGGLEYGYANFVEPNVGDIYDEYPLALYLHMADLEATYIDDKGTK